MQLSDGLRLVIVCNSHNFMVEEMRHLYCVGDIIDLNPLFREEVKSYGLILELRTAGWTVSTDTEIYQEFHIAKLTRDCTKLNTYASDVRFTFIRKVNEDDKAELLLHSLECVRKFALTL